MDTARRQSDSAVVRDENAAPNLRRQTVGGKVERVSATPSKATPAKVDLGHAASHYFRHMPKTPISKALKNESMDVSVLEESILDASVLNQSGSSSEGEDLLNQSTLSDTTELTASNFVLAATSRQRLSEASLMMKDLAAQKGKDLVAKAPRESIGGMISPGVQRSPPRGLSPTRRQSLGTLSPNTAKPVENRRQSIAGPILSEGPPLLPKHRRQSVGAPLPQAASRRPSLGSVAPLSSASRRQTMDGPNIRTSSLTVATPTSRRQTLDAVPTKNDRSVQGFVANMQAQRMQRQMEREETALQHEPSTEAVEPEAKPKETTELSQGSSSLMTGSEMLSTMGGEPESLESVPMFEDATPAVELKDTSDVKDVSMAESSKSDTLDISASSFNNLFDGLLDKSAEDANVTDEVVAHPSSGSPQDVVKTPNSAASRTSVSAASTLSSMSGMPVQSTEAQVSPKELPSSISYESSHRAMEAFEAACPGSEKKASLTPSKITASPRRGYHKSTTPTSLQQSPRRRRTTGITPTKLSAGQSPARRSRVAEEENLTPSPSVFGKMPAGESISSPHSGSKRSDESVASAASKSRRSSSGVPKSPSRDVADSPARNTRSQTKSPTREVIESPPRPVPVAQSFDSPARNTRSQAKSPNRTKSPLADSPARNTRSASKTASQSPSSSPNRTKSPSRKPVDSPARITRSAAKTASQSPSSSLIDSPARNTRSAAKPTEVLDVELPVHRGDHSQMDTSMDQENTSMNLTGSLLDASLERKRKSVGNTPHESFAASSKRRKSIGTTVLTSSLRKGPRLSTSIRKSVAFGSPEVAEYNISSPSVSMTPVPSRKAKEMYAMPDDTVEIEADMKALMSTIDNPGGFNPTRDPVRRPPLMSRRSLSFGGEEKTEELEIDMSSLLNKVATATPIQETGSKSDDDMSVDDDRSVKEAYTAELTVELEKSMLALLEEQQDQSVNTSSRRFSICPDSRLSISLDGNNLNMEMPPMNQTESSIASASPPSVKPARPLLRRQFIEVLTSRNTKESSLGDLLVTMGPWTDTSTNALVLETMAAVYGQACATIEQTMDDELDIEQELAFHDTSTDVARQLEKDLSTASTGKGGTLLESVAASVELNETTSWESWLVSCAEATLDPLTSIVDKLDESLAILEADLAKLSDAQKQIEHFGSAASAHARRQSISRRKVRHFHCTRTKNRYLTLHCRRLLMFFREISNPFRSSSIERKLLCPSRRLSRMRRNDMSSRSRTNQNSNASLFR